MERIPRSTRPRHSEIGASQTARSYRHTTTGAVLPCSCLNLDASISRHHGVSVSSEKVYKVLSLTSQSLVEGSRLSRQDVRSRKSRSSFCLVGGSICRVSFESNSQLICCANGGHPSLCQIMSNFECCVLVPKRDKLQKDLLLLTDWCLTGRNKVVQQASLQTICLYIFVLEALGHCIKFSLNT